MNVSVRRLRAVCFALPLLSFFVPFSLCEGRGISKPKLSARAAIVLDADDGTILYGKNPHLRLPPASTAKLMTVLVAMERLPAHRLVRVSRQAAETARSRAGLAPGAAYKAGDLMAAALVASSNDAAVALAEAVAGREDAFVRLMNAKAVSLGMRNTRFANATGLTKKGRAQYSTAYDLARLMRAAIRIPTIDRLMEARSIEIRGTDGKAIALRAHNKMLWRMPGFVKGKTGWTFASRHTFVGTDFERDKKITFALLYSVQPWVDIERLARFGKAMDKR